LRFKIYHRSFGMFTQLDRVKLPADKIVYMEKGQRDVLLGISYRFLTPDSTFSALIVEDWAMDTDTLQQCRTADNQVYWIGPAEVA
jgi:hypothetical protein